MHPHYTSKSINPAYSLRLSWTGWSSGEPFPAHAPPGVLDTLRHTWEDDGLRLLESEWAPDRVKLVVSTTPTVSPVFCAARLKGRFQHIMRQSSTPVSFRRKVSIRSVGHNRRSTVVQYLRDQVDTARFADPAFREYLRDFTVIDEDVDLSRPRRSRHGCYWYALHLVLVCSGRSTITDRSTLSALRDGVFQIGHRRQHRVAAVSVMPDHLHVALAPDFNESPEETALTYMNELARSVGIPRFWSPSYYAGTFGEYDMNAIRTRLRRRRDKPGQV